MKIESKFPTLQTVILVGAALYILLPDFFIGPVDDAVVALIAGIAEVAINFAKSHSLEVSTAQDEWKDF